MAGACKLIRNFDPDGVALPKMRTLLIDSQQIESGEAISAEFKTAAEPEIARFKDEHAPDGRNSDIAGPAHRQESENPRTDSVRLWPDSRQSVYRAVALVSRHSDDGTWRDATSERQVWPTSGV